MSEAFQSREKAFEAKFSLDQETAFKVMVRRDKLLGLWLAELMGMTGDEAETYAQSLIEADFEEPGDEDVVRKVMADLADKGIELSEHRLRKQMDKLAEEARAQITGR